MNQTLRRKTFLQGLPKYFSQLVMDHIKEKNKGHPNLENHIYGQILAEIKKVGLKMCYEMKWQKHAK